MLSPWSCFYWLVFPNLLLKFSWVPIVVHSLIWQCSNMACSVIEKKALHCIVLLKSGVYRFKEVVADSEVWKMTCKTGEK